MVQSSLKTATTLLRLQVFRPWEACVFRRKHGKKSHAGAYSLSGKGQTFKRRNKLQQVFQQWGFFSSNRVGKAHLKVMGVIRKEELCYLIQHQPNISTCICLGNKMCLKAAMKRYLQSRWKSLTTYCNLKNEGLVDPRHWVFNFSHLGFVLWTAGFFDANPAMLVSKPLVPFTFPGCK